MGDILAREMSLISKTYWGGMPFRFPSPPAGASAEPRILRTADFREVRALYWTPAGAGLGRPKVAVIAMHPRVDFTQHYTFPRLLAAGIGCLGAASRAEGDDTGLIHEELLLDLAACVAWLRERRGVRKVILLGNSGGGSLSAFYQAQASRPPKERLEATPSGAPTRFASVPMPEADALILLAAHRGQGQVLAGCIDGSLIDEDDPRSVDPALDPYAPENGFAPPPTWSRYEEGFVARYQEAQAARVARIDARALRWLKEKAEAKAAGDRRGADLDRVMVIYRTMASLHYVDRRLDPSPRSYGSLLSERPDRMNWKRVGFARTLTPEAWLSTWSANHTRADLVKNLAEVRCPVLCVQATRDREIFPETDIAPIEAALVAEDRCALRLDASHYFEGAPGARERPDTEALMDRVIPWITERFGGHILTDRQSGSVSEETSEIEDIGEDSSTKSAVDRHPTTQHWLFPPAREPLPGPIRRTNLRELMARPARFEHHLTVVGRVGEAQIEAVTASEPTPFAHINLSDEYALALPTGDPMLGMFRFLTFLSDPERGVDVGRLRHGENDLVLHPYGLLHWPGRLRPPFAPMDLGPGMRRTGLSLVICASKPCGATDHPPSVPASRAADAKAYPIEGAPVEGDGAPPLHLVEVAEAGGPEQAKRIGAIGEVGVELLVDPPSIRPKRGGWVFVLEGGGVHFPGDLLYLPEGAILEGAGIRRALLIASEAHAPEPPPESWERVPEPPLVPFEEAEPGALPLELPLEGGTLRVEARSESEVRIRIGEASAEVPRYWLARFLYRVALHGYAIGYLETYGGFYYDDREQAQGRCRLGLRGGSGGGGELVLTPAELPGAIERLYRAVAPPGYRERLT